jgi:hypothetical protein
MSSSPVHSIRHMPSIDMPIPMPMPMPPVALQLYSSPSASQSPSLPHASVQ